MPRLLVLHHSTYGRLEAMAGAVAEGARQVEGAALGITRVREPAPEERARKTGYKLDPAAPIAQISDLAGGRPPAGPPCRRNGEDRFG